GLVLVVSSIRLLKDPHDAQSLRQPNISVLLLTGGGLGLLAGLTGTGGGVFLTPLLLFRRWCTTKQAAACSVVFILLNSLAGLAGYVIARGGLLAGALGPLGPMMALSVPVVFAAGALGARFGSHHWPGTLLRRLLAIVLLLAATKLLALHG
ncbi:MAG: TSUP family transporter, partial [Cyanobium sp. LacPavin_0920_WC12_MAG_62_9]|nr:TSUP family transporter [Cyanobium sp. LacPavin_0920_WC12_MAG_62_9]